MGPKEILESTRKAIREHAGDDPDKWFYANRFVFARLQVDERKTKSHIKKELLKTQKQCPYCHGAFADQRGIHLHRVDDTRGYSRDNCILVHADCHTKYHIEHPRGYPGRDTTNSVRAILQRVSKHYEGHRFLYWWDLSPAFLDEIDNYEDVEFLKRDTGERCCVPVPALKGYLTQERQTSRHNGNWGIRVLKEREGELAFEPGANGGKWLFLPVVWLSETHES